MRLAVQLNSQFFLNAVKIQDVIADTELPPEFSVLELAVFQTAPQSPFRRSAEAAQGFAEWFEFGGVGGGTGPWWILWFDFVCWKRVACRALPSRSRTACRTLPYGGGVLFAFYPLPSLPGIKIGLAHLSKALLVKNLSNGIR